MAIKEKILKFFKIKKKNSKKNEYLKKYENEDKNIVTIITVLFGKEDKLLEKFGYLVQDLEETYKKNKDKIEVIVVVENENWKHNPQFQMLNVLIPEIKIIYLSEVSNIPAKLFNLGLKEAKGNYIMFNYLGCLGLKEKIDCFFGSSQDERIYYFENLKEINPSLLFTGNNEIEILFHEKLYGLNNFVYKREIFDEIGGFNESKILQRDFDTDFLIKILEQNFEREELDIRINSVDFEKYPFEEKISIKKDIVDRFLVRCQKMRQFSNEEIERSFFLDLDEKSIKELSFLNFNEKIETEYSYRFKIAVLGGDWEYHHNKICFFNYFDRLLGKGFCTYKFKLDYLTEESDLLNYDLVIFTRIKSEKGKDLLDFCNKEKIPTIYMLDDNWISIVKDYPEYGKIFEEGSVIYDNYMYVLQNSTLLWSYNDYLIEDFKPFAKKIIKAKLGIDIEKNSKELCIDEKKKKLIVGFSGSLRFDNKAFKALLRIKREDIQILLFGVISGKQEKLFENQDIIKEKFLKYEEYIKRMKEIKPDLLIAPLSFDRTSSSKCYNKYLENSSIGAATLFSKVPPYVNVVKENETGFFVEEETVDGWCNSIENILNDRELLFNVQKNAYNDVLNNHSVDTFLSWFMDTIKRIIKEGV